LTYANQGFTLIEVMVALVIASLIIGVGAPAAFRFYETNTFREAVRTVQSAANTARYRAISSGRPWDLLIDADGAAVLAAPGVGKVVEGDLERLGDSIRVEAVTAQEYSRLGFAAIRFFPSGSSSGGSLRIGMEGRPSVAVNVDWLLGRVTQVSDTMDE
jgi:prepilin-type N-terminal cleavage/methylation domain-containing protein